MSQSNHRYYFHSRHHIARVVQLLYRPHKLLYKHLALICTCSLILFDSMDHSHRVEWFRCHHIVQSGVLLTRFHRKMYKLMVFQSIYILDLLSLMSIRLE